MKKILALDLGTKTGWALCNSQGVVKSGSINFMNTRFESVGMRYLKFNEWMTNLNLECGKFDIIYFEEVNRHLGTAAAHAYGAYMGHLMSWCELNKIPYQGIGVGTIKKSATGKGNANKEDMADAAKKLIGHFPADDNEADAICLLYHVMKNKGGV